MLLDGPDPLDDAMEDLRVCGSVLLHETYGAPWAIAVPHETRLREVLGVGSDVRVLVFHFVRREGFELRIDGRDAVSIQTAEIAICTSGDAHLMSRGGAAPAVPLEALLRGAGPTPAARGTCGATELVCGVFYVRAAPLNPMLGALPPLLRVATDDVSVTPMLANVAAMLAHEIDRGALKNFTAARLLEVFCAEAIRAYLRSAGAEARGWLEGLGDARISQAIRHIHAAPAREWTVQALATTVALSASRFAARFRETTGHSVMRYLARWRANMACRMLRDTDLHLSEIASRVGYQSLPAFSRAFKAQLGQAPAAWRISSTRARARNPLAS